MLLAHDQKYRPMERIESPEINQSTSCQLIYNKGGKNKQGSGTTNGSGNTGKLHVKE